jgi:hypothetical protein
MIKRIACGLGMAMLLAAAPALAQQQTMAQQTAANLQKMVGQKFEGDLLISAVAAESNTLVVTVDGQSGWSGLSQDQITNLLLAGFCQSPNAATFFQSSWLRVDTLDHGAGLKHGSPVNTCPATQ